ncbi:MAG: DUF420 domain-containing protein [Myxococcota bacterium]|nr:DUF420 domain-containing protein [Myxococcota bacterium]
MQIEEPIKQSFWVNIIWVLSLVVSLVVSFLILGPRPANLMGALDVSALPLVNATLNALTALLLVIGTVLIKLRRITEHRRVMLAAFTSSILFLVTYVVYHWFKAGPKPYLGDFKVIYYSILISHIVLAAAVIPLALFTLFRGWTGDIGNHRRIAKITLPIWLYVSMTGVLIYWMLY